MIKTAAGHRLGAGPWRDLVRLVLASLATGALVSLVLALAVFLVATEARASPVPARASPVPARAFPVAARASTAPALAALAPAEPAPV